ncbi:MAG: thioredoxin family protein [Opitutus sp.]
MNNLLGFGFCFVAALTAQASVKIGDSYASVVAEKGTPGGKMNVRGVVMLCYADETIKLKDDKVVSIDTPRAPAISSAPAEAPALPSAKIKRAIWNTNYETALAQAKEQNRHVFMFFTGSDWCGWCQRLNAEILKTPEFQKFANEKLVLLELDFPHNKSQAPGTKAQNQKLAQEFGITGYPTVIVLNSRGKPIGHLGYQEGGPKPFIEDLKTM